MNRIKKKNIKGILVSILAFFMPIFVSAQTTPPTVTIVGPSSVSPSEDIEYTIILNGLQSDASTNPTFNTTVSFDSNVFTLKEIKKSGNWDTESKIGSSPANISFNCKNGNCNNEVGKIIFKVASKPKVNKPQINFDSNAAIGSDTYPLGTINKDINIKSNDATLSSIKVNGTSVENFNSENLSYDVSVTGDIAIAKIEAKTTSSKATFKDGFGPRDVNLEYGNNTIKLNVISESGTELVYDINITREDTRSTDATLSGISIDGTALESFKSNKYKYTLKKYKVETIKIEGITNDPNAKTEIIGPQKLLIGENEFKIVVTSEKGEKATYTVIINNLDKNISKMLKSLSIKGYNINFDKNNYQYKINYNRLKFDDLKIFYATVSPEDEVKVVMNPDINNNRELIKSLKVGDEIEITITGIDGESSKYTIVIERDKRVSFFLLLELFLIFGILIAILVLWIKRKKEDNDTKNNKVVEKKEEIKEEKKEEKKLVAEPRRERRRSGIEEKKEEDLESTKELTTKELNL